ncbi:MAG TPA: type IX secretion system membrane protein PorP/SprF [Chryseolinea sp.]|nr:type IX secretion system membrane protein PorP/SprF [Chryseolinea sp.]
MKRAHTYYLTTSLIAIFSLLVAGATKAQQLPQFTQFMYNNLVINPAYAGADEALSLTLLHRSQWTGVDKAPSTQSFSAHSLIRKKQIGLGLTVIRDEIGVHKNTNIMTNYAYHINVAEKTFLSMGLQVGLTNLKSDYASLASAPVDPKLVNSINETMIDFGAGLYLRSPRFDLSLSSPGLLSRTVSVSDSVSVNFKRANVMGFARYRFSLSDNFDMEPGIMIKYFTTLPFSYDLNLNFIYRSVLTTGVSYRKDESIDLILRFQISPQLQFGYAYDYPISYAARLSSASHELMLNYIFRDFKKRAASPR